MNTDHLATLPLWYVAFLLSLTCHEAAHALVAKWGGDLTAYYAGQVTLDPLPHIRREPFGTVLVPLLTFFLSGWMLGWGSAPYDPYWEQRHPRRASWMALAGPVANFILAALAAVVIWIGIATGLFATHAGVGLEHLVAGSGDVADGAAQFFSILFSLNVLLGSFNLIPVAPLDGHSVVGLFLPERLYFQFLGFVRQPMASMLGILVAWRVFDVVGPAVFSVAITVLGTGIAIVR